MDRADPLLERLQALRFLAAAAVVIRHIFMELEQHGVAFPLRDIALQIPWGAGVDVFFVISGFVITVSAVDKPQSAGAAGDFIVRRLIRLWPTYALFTALMLVAMAAIPDNLNHPTIDPAHTAASFVFLPWPEPGDAALYPVLGQGWTLNYEMFFYACFAGVMLAPARHRIGMLWAGGVALVLAGLVWKLPLPLGYWADTIVLEFLFGVALAGAYRRVQANSSWMVLAALAGMATVVFVSMSWPDLPRVVKAGIPALLIVGGIVFSGRTVEKWFGCPPLATLGNASYALYLSHTFTVNLLLIVWMKLGFDAPWAFVAIAFIASVAVSLATYLVLEKPSMAFLKDQYSNLRSRRRARLRATTLAHREGSAL